MIRFEIDLKNHKTKAVSMETLASNSCKVDHIEITDMTDDWDGRNLYASFLTEETGPIIVPVIDNIAEIPWEVLQGPQFEVGFYWTEDGKVMTSTLIPCYVAPGAGITGTAAQPTPEIYERFTEAAETASDLLQQALSKATTSYVYKETAPPSQINLLYVDLEDYYYHESDMVLVFLNGEKMYEGYELAPVEGELYINFNPGVAGEIEVDIIAGMGGGANVDPTLTIEGEAADAKVTGDNIRRIDGIIDGLGDDMDQVESELATAQGNITNLQGRMTTAEGEIDSLQLGLNTAQGDITALGGRMTAAEGDISSIQTDVHNIWGDLAIHDAKIRSLQSRMITAENNITLQGNRLSTAEGSISNLQLGLNTAQGDITALQGRVTTAEGDITALGSRVTANEGNITSLGTRMTAAEGDISDLQAADVSLDARVTALENIGLADNVGY